MTPLSNNTLRGWKLTLIILSVGLKGLRALVPERVAFHVAECFIAAYFRRGALLILVTQGMPPWSVCGSIPP